MFEKEAEEAGDKKIKENHQSTPIQVETEQFISEEIK